MSITKKFTEVIFYSNFENSKIFENLAKNVYIQARSPFPHRPGAAGGLGLILVNLAESSRTVQIASEEDAVELQVWTLTPTSAGPFGAGALLNGKALPTHVADGRTIDDEATVCCACDDSTKASVALSSVYC